MATEPDPHHDPDKTLPPKSRRSSAASDSAIDQPHQHLKPARQVTNKGSDSSPTNPENTETRELRTEHLPTLGKFAIEEKIGEGGMGVVYRGYDADLHRRVAIKRIHPKLIGDRELSDRFVLEARAVAAITHPNIAQIYSIHADEPDQPAFFVMEYVEGKPVDYRVRESGPLPIADALEIVTQAARGLRAAHRQGIVHRDVKPANLVLTPQGLVKLVDFGLSRTQGELSGHSEKGIVLGTPHYVSPEQSRGWKVDHRSDIYSLGCTLYYLLCGKPPFEAKNQMDVFMAHLNDEAEPISKRIAQAAETHVGSSESAVQQTAVVQTATIEEVDGLIKRMMSKQPEDRFQDCDELLARLRELQAPADNSGSHRPALTPTHSPIKSLAAFAIMLTIVGSLAFVPAVRDWLNLSFGPPQQSPEQIFGEHYSRDDSGVDRLNYNFSAVTKMPIGIESENYSDGSARKSRPPQIEAEIGLVWENYIKPVKFPSMTEFHSLELSGLVITGEGTGGNIDFELKIGTGQQPDQHLEIRFTVRQIHGVAKNNNPDAHFVQNGETIPLTPATKGHDWKPKSGAEYTLRIGRALDEDFTSTALSVQILQKGPPQAGTPGKLILQEEILLKLPGRIPLAGAITLRCEGTASKPWRASLKGATLLGKGFH